MGKCADVFLVFMQESSIAVVLPQKPEKQEKTSEQAPTDKHAEAIKVCKPVWHVLGGSSERHVYSSSSLMKRLKSETQILNTKTTSAQTVTITCRNANEVGFLLR